MDIDHIDQQATTIQYRAMIMTLVEVVLIGLLIALFTRYFVSSPIRKLMEGTKAVSAMDLDQRINIQTGGELGELAASFNVMQTRLKAAMNEINEFTHGLERKVDERTRQLSMTQQRLIQSDRLACLGQLAATVAHEINNPISGVLNLSMILQRLLREDSIPPGRLEEFRGYLNSITEETARVGRIVTDLLAFSRRSVPQTADADLNKIVMDTISLILHKLKLSSVTMDLELAEDLPVIPCDVSQMQQVIVNLVMNAAESIIGGGRVVLRTSLGEEGNSVVMEVEDSGAGIPEENLPRIFDPFFTTKEPGRGIGLGLSVVHGIVVAHGGTIGVTSRPGLGSTFTVHLPLYRSKAAGDGVSQGAERWNGA